MNKSVAVIADRLLCDNKDIADAVKCTLPEIKWLTVTLSGAGIGGNMDIPLQGLAEAMSFQVDLRGVGMDNAPILMRPGMRHLELRFNRDRIDSSGRLIKAGTKIFVSGYHTALSPGGIQRGSAMDSNATFAVVRYRWVEDGRELFLIDQDGQQYKADGVDYSSRYRL